MLLLQARNQRVLQGGIEFGIKRNSCLAEV